MPTFMPPNLSTFTAIVLPCAPFKMATVVVKVICVDALTHESSPFKVKSASVQIPLSVTVFLTVGSCLCPMLCPQDGRTFGNFCKVKCNLGKVQTKLMLRFCLRYLGGLQEGLLEHCYVFHILLLLSDQSVR